MQTVDKNLYRNGIRFECTGCGDCCRARGSYAYVYLTLPERRRLAAHLGLATGAFTRKYCETKYGVYYLKDPSNNCLFLDGARCTVYEARPQQCRTWPFWPENMTRRAWPEVKKECPGIGRGAVVEVAEIEANIADELRRENEN